MACRSQCRGLNDDSRRFTVTFIRCFNAGVAMILLSYMRSQQQSWGGSAAPKSQVHESGIFGRTGKSPAGRGALMSNPLRENGPSAANSGETNFLKQVY